MSILPNAIRRIDAITEAIRDGDRELAVELIEYTYRTLPPQAEFLRVAAKHAAQFEELNRIYKSLIEADNDAKWLNLRRACGWSGVDGFEGPVETLPPVKPKLRAEDLPVRTAMFLGRCKYRLEKQSYNMTFSCDQYSSEYVFTRDEIQELIGRGVRFELPKEGEK